MISIFWIYKYIFDYKIKGTITTFLSYPWILILILIFLVGVLKKSTSSFTYFIQDYIIIVIGEYIDENDKNVKNN